MSISMLIRRTALLFLVALVSACSSTKTSPDVPSGKAASSSPTVTTSQAADSCRSNRSKCIYKGQYEAGERDYAEKEAKRLNMAELERLRRAFGN
ncbi:hypothetical protein [Bordetella genomosp. 11]|nr:hypothetical protein [Bordetella genomosp. 11]